MPATVPIASNLPPPSRILLLCRSAATGCGPELIKRADAWYCLKNNREQPPAGLPILTLRAALQLRRRLRAGAYDLVITFDNPEQLWRSDKSFSSNLARFLRKVFLRRRTLGTYLVPWMLAGTHVPLAVFDWDDNTVVARKNWPLLDRATCYFKTQTPRNPYKAFLFQDERADCLFNIVRVPRLRDYAQKLRPFSVGVKPPAAWDPAAPPEKKTDVFFAGAVHYSYARQEGLRLLEELRDEGFNIDLFPTGPGRFLDEAEFLRRCAQAWLVWSPEGAGWDCVRHYWAPLVGSVPLLNDPDTRRLHPLRNGVHAFYYQVEGDDLKRAVREALQDQARLRTMAVAGADHVHQYLTHAALAEHLITETLRTAREQTAAPRPDPLSPDRGRTPLDPAPAAAR